MNESMVEKDGYSIVAGLADVLRHAQLCAPVERGPCPTCGLVVHAPPFGPYASLKEGE